MILSPPPGRTVQEWYFGEVSGVSNSGLTKTKHLMEGTEPPPSNSAFFRLGNMVDAYLLQKAEWDMDATQEEKRHAMALANKLLAHPLCATIIKAGDRQAVFRREVVIDLEGIEKVVLSKCMVDAAHPRSRTALDIKTGAFTSHESFLTTIERFSYDRAAYWYSEAGEFDTFILAGIGKKGHGPFIHIIKRGDPMWLAGKEKATVLAYYHDIIT